MYVVVPSPTKPVLLCRPDTSQAQYVMARSRYNSLQVLFPDLVSRTARGAPCSDQAVHKTSRTRHRYHPCRDKTSLQVVTTGEHVYLEKPGVNDVPVVHPAVLVELCLRELLDCERDLGESPDRFGRI